MISSVGCEKSRPPKTNLVVHGVQPVRGDDIPRVDQPVEGACALGQVGIVRVLRSDAVEYQIEAV